ncbi:MAG: alpha-amylase family glycosyl hydrolase [Gammaproteobacteria bacterium]
MLLASSILALGFLATAACTSSSDPGQQSAAASDKIVRVVPQQDWADAIIYFVLIDRFADGDAGNNQNVDRNNPGGWHGGDLEGLTQQLNEIAELGATAIWINPVQAQMPGGVFASGPPETGTQGGFEHTGFHGYWINDFNSVDPHFGSEADLKAFVEAAHERGIKVLLDVVYNHAGYGSRYLTDPQYKGWIRTRPVDCAADPLTCQVGGLPDFVTEDEEVRTYLLDANIGLAKRTGVDGFRLDTVKHIDHEFWQEHRARTRAELGDDFYLLGEVWGGSNQVLDEWFVNDEIDSGFDFTFRGSCRGFVDGKGRTIAFAAYLEKRHRIREGYQTAQYLSSHDEPLMLYELGNDLGKFKVCVGLQMATLGTPVIYYGEEVGRGGSVWPLNRNDMPWGTEPVNPGRGEARNEELRDYYKTLIEIRRQHRALTQGSFERLYWEGDLLVFRRSDQMSGDEVIVAVNRGGELLEVGVPAPESWTTGAMEAVTGTEAVIQNGALKVSVPAMTIRVFTP